MSHENKSHWYERHPRWTLLFIVFFGTLLVIALAEIVARNFFPQWAPVTAERAKFWQFDSDLGWSQTPNRTGNFEHPDFSIQVSINSLGLRDDEYPLVRTQKKRMLVLGDSYGWGFGVNHEEIFTELMEVKHSDWEIINASVSGYGTVQEYLYLAKRGLVLKPDVVLLLFYDNDFQDNVGSTEYWYSKPIVTKKDDHYVIAGVPVQPPTLRQRLDVFFLGNFYLMRGLYVYLQMPVNLIDNLFNPTVQTPPIDNLEASGYILGKMMDLAQTNGIKMIVVETPLSDIKHAVIEQRCKEYSVSCFHLNKVFKGGGKQSWHFEHDRHWNAEGHRMAAGAVDEFLTQQRFWDNPKGLVF